MGEPRALELAELGAIMPEVDRLLRAGYRPVGNWSLGQICGHLAQSTLASVEGMPFRAPWLVRVLVGRLVWRQVRRSGSLARGLPLPRRFKPAPTLDDRAEAEGLRAAIGIFARHAGPFAIHPLFGTMTRDDWQRFHTIHAAHHLGFLLPGSDSPLDPAPVAAEARPDRPSSGP